MLEKNNDNTGKLGFKDTWQSARLHMIDAETRG
jgi:hypothetical protein